MATRILLWLLAAAELVLGAFGLSVAGILLFSHAGGMNLIFLPVAGLFSLFMVAGIAILVHRPWSYYLHIVLILLIGFLLVLYLGPLVGSDAGQTVLVTVTIVAVLTALFFVPSVRRYFRIGVKSTP